MSYPLAVLAHRYLATRDSYAPPIADLIAAEVAGFHRAGLGA